MKAVLRELKRQKDANRAGLRFFDEFASHRQNQTEFILSGRESGGGRLCVLGAGNCFDLDLPRVVQTFDEVHLVDIDPGALKTARERLDDEAAQKITLHAPVDVSGANDKLEAWRDMRVTPEALLSFPEAATNALLRKLPAPFDCVVSACITSQLLLTYRRVLGERHQLFQAGLITLLVTHLRVLSALTKPGGQALFITDVTTDEIAPLGTLPLGGDASLLLEQLARQNLIFNYLDPALLASLAAEDPILSESVEFRPPEKVWLWQNTRERAFLVYGARLLKR
jgi:hypothetical protein